VSGPELDDIAHQATADALMTMTARLGEFRGASRFTTWACKFVMFEVSGKMARHHWRKQPPALDEDALRSAEDRLTPQPFDRVEERERLTALRDGLHDSLTAHQRTVFVAAALNEVSIDVLALQLGSNRNAVYKALFDARRKLRACLAAAGHPLAEESTA
jgi:RNA polymerase sigma-70 factor (ECF subfamily)